MIEDNNEIPTINWEMDEYLQHKRGIGWYVFLGLGALGLSALSYFITGGEIIAPISILLMTGLLGFYAIKKPKRCQYVLSSLGIKIGTRLYDYSNFRTFSLIKDNGVAALYLIANQRFIPPLTIYLPLDKDKMIIKMLSQYIAYTPYSLQWSDRIMQYLRF